MEVDFILPSSFDNKKQGPGHKKDLLNIKNFLTGAGVYCSLYFSDSINVYSDSNQDVQYNLTDFLQTYDEEDKILIIGPLFSFRKIIRKLPKNTYIYVADSPLKTSIFAFFNKPFLFYRVVYNYFVERRLLNRNIIVASEDEYNWFSSNGVLIENLSLLIPMPYIDNVSSVKKNQTIKDDIFRVLFFNPNGQGLHLCNCILDAIPSDLLNKIQLTILGPESQRFLRHKTKPVVFQYVDDIDSLIKESDIIVLTDIGGSGLCNRSVQVRELKKRLLTTISGVRGTNLYYDSEVYIYNDCEGFIKTLSFIISQKPLLNYQTDSVDLFKTKCMNQLKQFRYKLEHYKR